MRHYDLPRDRMPEAEVSLRLAQHLVRAGDAKRVIVAIDGAQVRTANRVHFDPTAFMHASGWNVPSADSWRGTYQLGDRVIEIHSRPGLGDVVCDLPGTGSTLRAECKKGNFSATGSSPEYPALREALGQLLTIEAARERDLLVVAVPHSAKFVELAQRWRDAPLVKRAGIRIVTVSRDGEVLGFEQGDLCPTR